MTAALVFALAALSIHCDRSVEDGVAARLPRDAGSWLIHCVDDTNLELTRVTPDGRARARTVSLGDVAGALRIDLVLLAAEALLAPAAPLRAPTAPPEAAAPDGATSAAADGPRDPSPTVEVVVVPSRPADASFAPSSGAMRGAPWQSSRRRRLALVTVVASRIFPTAGTWLLGGGVGLDGSAGRITLNGAASDSAGDGLRVRAVAVEAEASLALYCISGASTAACVRASAEAGVASVTGLAGAASVTARSGVTPLFGAAAAFEIERDFGAALIGLGCRVGATAGPRAVVAASSGPEWAGVTLGLSMHARWE